MKHFIFFLLMVPLIAFCQHTDSKIDTLKNYSYLLALCVPKDNNYFLSGMSTGFLIKDSKNVYLVSAYHVFTQTNTTSNGPSAFIHKGMAVRIKSSPDNGSINNNFFVNLESLKEWGKKISLYTTPDVYFYKTAINPNTTKIYSIENILNERRDKKNTKMEVISYGYLNHATDDADIWNYPPLTYIGKIADFSKISNISYFKNIDSLHFVSNPKTVDGTSGSPVFFKYSKGSGKSKKEWVEFGGLMVATDSLTNTTVILKKEFFIKAFEKYKKSVQ